MTIQIEKETKTEFSFSEDTYIRMVIETAADYVGCPYEAEVDVLFTDNNGIKELNFYHRGLNRPTDVLSFPMVEYASPADFTLIEEQQPECFHPETGELLLGDIVLSYDKIKEQAAEYGHSELRELCFLVAHSMLHLFGYDHMKEDERIQMETMQEEILEKLGISR